MNPVEKISAFYVLEQDVEVFLVFKHPHKLRQPGGTFWITPCVPENLGFLGGGVAIRKYFDHYFDVGAIVIYVSVL